MTPRRRLLVVATLALAVVAAAVIASPGARQPTEPSTPTAAESTLFDGLPQDGIALGSPDARDVLVEFADLQCPFCAAYARDTLPALVDRYVRTGRLRLELHVLTFLGEDSVRAGAMAAAAARQDRLWSFTDAFYRSQGAENSGYVTDDFLRRTGEAAGLDVARAFADRERPRVLEPLAEAQRAAAALKVPGTPAFFLRRGDGPPRPIELSQLDAELRAR